MRRLSLIGGSIVAIGAGFTAFAAMSGGAAETPVVQQVRSAPPASTRPADADYAVPGVLDYRSWKPAYDVAPARAHPASLYRAALQGNRTFRHAPAPATIVQTEAAVLPSDLSQAAAALQDDDAPTP